MSKENIDNSLGDQTISDKDIKEEEALTFDEFKSNLSKS
jgi:hypothetical protein